MGDEVVGVASVVDASQDSTSTSLRALACAAARPPAPARLTRAPRHGPSIQWTHRIVEGKTVTRYLSKEQRDRHQVWFDNARRLKDLVAKLEIASIHAVEQAEGWTNPTQSTDEDAPYVKPARPRLHRIPPGRNFRRAAPD